MKLKGEHVFVTGGAAGIGAAIVLDAAREGAKVSFCDIDVPKAEAYIEELRSENLEVFFHEADVSNFESVRIAHSSVVDHFGEVTGLVNNAGVNAYFDPVEMTDSQWEHFFNIDLKSVWHTAKCVLPGMRRAKSGSIVNIASIHARMTFPNFFPYSAAKAGVLGLTRNLALDEGVHGIRTNAVSPGFTRTPLMEAWLLADPKKNDERNALQPMGRMGRSDEIAKVVTFLLSEDASFVNGADWAVDGGLSARYA